MKNASFGGVSGAINAPGYAMEIMLYIQNRFKPKTEHIDESGFAQDKPRAHGYSHKGTRCFGKKDWGAKGRINVIGALLGKTLLCSCLLECNVDSEVFHTWVTQQLLSLTQDNAVIVMDNTTLHKRSDTLQAITQAGLTLKFLPPYFPQLKPIEKLWDKAKAIRKRLLCSIFELFDLHVHNLSNLI